MWHRPAEWDESGEDGLDYIVSPDAIDHPFVLEDYSALLITKKEFDQKVAALGKYRAY